MTNITAGKCVEQNNSNNEVENPKRRDFLKRGGMFIILSLSLFLEGCGLNEKKDSSGKETIETLSQKKINKPPVKKPINISEMKEKIDARLKIINFLTEKIIEKDPYKKRIDIAILASQFTENDPVEGLKVMEKIFDPFEKIYIGGILRGDQASEKVLYIEELNPDVVINEKISGLNNPLAILDVLENDNNLGYIATEIRTPIWENLITKFFEIGHQDKLNPQITKDKIEQMLKHRQVLGFYLITQIIENIDRHFYKYLLNNPKYMQNSFKEMDEDPFLNIFSKYMRNVDLYDNADSMNTLNNHENAIKLIINFLRKKEVNTLPPTEIALHVINLLSPLISSAYSYRMNPDLREGIKTTIKELLEKIDPCTPRWIIIEDYFEYRIGSLMKDAQYSVYEDMGKKIIFDVTPQMKEFLINGLSFLKKLKEEDPKYEQYLALLPSYRILQQEILNASSLASLNIAGVLVTNDLLINEEVLQAKYKNEPIIGKYEKGFLKEFSDYVQKNQLSENLLLAFKKILCVSVLLHEGTHEKDPINLDSVEKEKNAFSIQILFYNNLLNSKLESIFPNLNKQERILIKLNLERYIDFYLNASGNHSVKQRNERDKTGKTGSCPLPIGINDKILPYIIKVLQELGLGEQEKNFIKKYSTD